MIMEPWIEADARANGITIHYTRTGGDKPPVVLSHGITDNGRCWQRVAEALAAEYDLIMYDARGHGRSDAPEHGHRTEDRAADLIGLIEALDLDRPALLGHSMGAETSALAAATAPELVRGVALEDPPWREMPHSQTDADAAHWRANLAQWRANVQALQVQPLEQVIADARDRWPNWDMSELEPWAEAQQQTSLHVFTWMTEPRTPWQPVVQGLACPALLITADPQLGALVTPEVAQEAAALNPRLRVVRIEQAGHSIRRDQFERYIAVVRDFLRSLL
jgi:N-formylmaleamate deformylase